MMVNHFFKSNIFYDNPLNVIVGESGLFTVFLIEICLTGPSDFGQLSYITAHVLVEQKDPAIISIFHCPLPLLKLGFQPNILWAGC